MSASMNVVAPVSVAAVETLTARGEGEGSNVTGKYFLATVETGHGSLAGF